MKRPSQARQVEEFNQAHQVGTAVRVWPGTRPGRSIDVKTTNRAHLLGGHTAVVWVDGLSGCIALSHVEVLG